MPVEALLSGGKTRFAVGESKERKFWVTSGSTKMNNQMSPFRIWFWVRKSELRYIFNY